MRQIKAPNRVDSEIRIFLAGSIEMGAAEKWQDRVVREMADYDNLVFLNPRRDDWDSSWEQSIDNEQFYDQVTWELDWLDGADFVFMYFDPATKSPITLLEMGLYARSGKLLVVCPEGFYRKGNVDVTCEYYNVPQADTLEEGIKLLRFLMGE
jgi:hypothetical protein